MIQARKLQLAVDFDVGVSSRKVFWDDYPVVQNLVRRVGAKCMELIISQVDLASDFMKQRARTQRAASPCTGRFKAQFGLPCSHTIVDTIDNGNMLMMEDIHPHWWLKASTSEEEARLAAHREPDPDIVQKGRRLVSNDPKPLPKDTASSGRILSVDERDGNAIAALLRENAAHRKKALTATSSQRKKGKQKDSGVDAQLKKLVVDTFEALQSSHQASQAAVVGHQPPLQHYGIPPSQYFGIPAPQQHALPVAHWPVQPHSHSGIAAHQHTFSVTPWPAQQPGYPETIAHSVHIGRAPQFTGTSAPAPLADQSRQHTASNYVAGSRDPAMQRPELS
ncbi:hypothetical protein E4U33_000792 [Claviceps sp. LM78 group G4]|nr:hypothetical protein E4U33_000792 [Claviceps sp. LM78 group G4]